MVFARFGRLLLIVALAFFTQFFTTTPARAAKMQCCEMAGAAAKTCPGCTDAAGSSQHCCASSAELFFVAQKLAVRPRFSTQCEPVRAFLALTRSDRPAVPPPKTA